MGEEQKLENEEKDVVAIRDSNYGGFDGISATCQQLKDIARSSPAWESLTPPEREGVDMILHKLSRILHSPKKIRDSWVDIGGYARVTLKALDATGVKMS